MDAYDFFETDGAIEKEGIYVKYPTLGFKVLVAHSGGNNTKWKKELTNISAKHNMDDLDFADQEVLGKDLMKAFIKAIIRKWEVSYTDEKTQEVSWKEGIIIKKPDGSKSIEKPTFDNIRKVLLDLPKLYEDLQRKAGEWERFRKTEEDTIIKK